ncbi:MAG: DUF2062 domain-containing protein [Ahrensia sp.]|nr:DUF2062 domain-containing protein [Ahrensia sp.]
MLFSRRNNDSFWTRMRVYFWPRRNHSRSTRYMWKRVLRIRASPHAIGLGFSAGAFASFTPFMGFHFLLSFALAWITRSSFIAAGLGTAVGNPLTFPLIWASTLSFGRTILGRTADQTAHADGFLTTLTNTGFVAVWDPYILPMIVGGVPIGIVAAVICYFPVKKAAETFQNRRSMKIAERQSKIGLTNPQNVQDQRP